MKNIFKLYLLTVILVSYQALNSKNKGLELGANSCYFDASIQALSHLDEFNSEIDKYNFDEMTTSKIYLKLVHKIKNSWKENQEFVLRKDSLNEHVTLEAFHLGWTQKLEETKEPKEPKKRNLRGQEDANEFLMLFFNSLNKEINDYTEKIKQNAKLFGCDDDAAEYQVIIQMQQLNLTNPFNLIEGQTKSITKCQTCNTKKLGMATFKILGLNIPDKDNLSLKDCLENLATEEISSPENKRLCYNCGDDQPFSESTKLSTTSKYLIIQLNRFTFGQISEKPVKIRKAIKFSPKLILDKNCSFLDDFIKNKLADNKIIYNLLAFIVHGGESANSGHYWAYGKDENDKWWRYDDQIVSDGSVERKKGKSKINDSVDYILKNGLDNKATPYVLFYELAEDIQDEPVLDEPILEPNPLQENLKNLQAQLTELKKKLQKLQDKLGNLKAKLEVKR